MTVKGIDISQWQATTPPLGGLDFVFVKATEGTLVDPKYHLHATDVRAAGKILGAYSFSVDGLTGADQANRMLAVIGSDTRLVALDMEGAHEASIAQARDWIATMKAAGRVAGVYHSLSGFPLTLGQDFNWVADWNPGPPDIHWDFWQTTSSGSIAGYAGRLDMDVFAGTIDGLRRLAGLTPPAYPASLGPKPAKATGYIAIPGKPFLAWNSATRRTGYSGRRFSAWVYTLNLLYNGETFTGYRVLTGGYRDWTIFAGPGVAYRAVP